MDFSAARSTFGPPGRPTLLFVHGIRLGRAIWEPHAAHLTERYRVVTLDLPGHGSLVKTRFTQEHVDALFDETLATLDAPPLIVGYSLGGFVTMRYVAEHLHCAAGLLLTGCTVDFDGWKWWPYGTGVSLSQLIPDAVFNAIAQSTLHATLPHAVAATIERIPFDRDVLVQTSALARHTTRLSDAIAPYRGPVLFVNGEYDFPFRVDERIFLHRLPQARLHVMRGTDHGAPLVRPQEFAGIVDAFAKSVFPTSTNGG